MWYCTQCGQQCTDAFCARCGAPKPAEPGQAQPNYQYAAPPPPPPPPVYQAVPQYPPPGYGYTPPPQPDATVSVGEWVVTLIVSAIPLVGFIMLLVWAFGSDTKPSKANYCKAALIIMLIGVALGVILSIALGALVGSFITTWQDSIQSFYH